MFIISLFIASLNILGYTLFSKIFDNTSSYNMYITYVFIAFHILINMFYVLLLIVCFYERRNNVRSL
jgi:uncharacterized membrane protein